jgi:hypothetical protein
MKLLTALFAVNLMLLVLHEIESAFFREWEILKLPGKITGFMLLHVPILLVLFFGLLEIDRLSVPGLVIGLVAGAGGALPLVVPKLLAPRADAFHLPISNIVMILNVLSGAGLIVWCVILLAG